MVLDQSQANLIFRPDAADFIRALGKVTLLAALQKCTHRTGIGVVLLTAMLTHFDVLAESAIVSSVRKVMNVTRLLSKNCAIAADDPTVHVLTPRVCVCLARYLLLQPMTSLLSILK